MQFEIRDIITIIGLIIAFVGGQLTSRAQSQLEFKKWVRSRQDDVRRDIRIAVAEVAEQLASFAHSMMWVTYNLHINRGSDIEIIEVYHKESHEFIGRLVGSQIRLAALDMTIYQKVTPIISKTINLSEEVTNAIKQFQHDKVQGEQILHESNQKALSFIKELPDQIGNTIGIDNPG